MSFKGLNLSSKMIDSLNRQKYFNPSPIQNRAIPKALKGETLMVQSSTGSGKTLCYLIPIIENIDYKDQNIQAIIIAPTRELAVQIYECAHRFTSEFKNLKVKSNKKGVKRSSSYCHRHAWKVKRCIFR